MVLEFSGSGAADASRPAESLTRADPAGPTPAPGRRASDALDRAGRDPPPLRHEVSQPADHNRCSSSIAFPGPLVGRCDNQADGCRGAGPGADRQQFAGCADRHLCRPPAAPGQDRARQCDGRCTGRLPGAAACRRGQQRNRQLCRPAGAAGHRAARLDDDIARERPVRGGGERRVRAVRAGEWRRSRSRRVCRRRRRIEPWRRSRDVAARIRWPAGTDAGVGGGGDRCGRRRPVRPDPEIGCSGGPISARLYRRYGNWPDAVAAYNWGPGNLDEWIVAGRPSAGLPLEVERYRDRVLRDGGVEALASRCFGRFPEPEIRCACGPRRNCP